MNHENGVREAQSSSIALPVATAAMVAAMICVTVIASYVASDAQQSVTMTTTVAIAAMICVTVIASYIARGVQQQSITPKNHTPTLSADPAAEAAVLPGISTITTHKP